MTDKRITKGPNIAPSREQRARTIAAHASMAFSDWAGVKASALEAAPLDPVFAFITAVERVQIRLAAWQADRFANAPTSDVHIALGVIEEMGEAFDAVSDPEGAVDAVGDVCVYAAQLCTANRLSFAPVLNLAQSYRMDGAGDMDGMAIVGRLAHVVLKHSQGIRGLGPREAYLPCLVDCLALAVAWATVNAELLHDLEIDPAGVFITVGNEVMQRKAGDAMIPGAPGVPTEQDVHTWAAEIRAKAEAAKEQRVEAAHQHLERAVDVLGHVEQNLATAHGAELDALARLAGTGAARRFSPELLEGYEWNARAGSYGETDETLRARLNGG